VRLALLAAALVLAGCPPPRPIGGPEPKHGKPADGTGPLPGDEVLAVPAAAARAVPALEKACAADDAAACRRLGHLHAHGVGLAPDLAGARELYADACELGDGAACAALGALLADGRGGGDAPLEAVGRLREACDLGAAEGCATLARTFENGEGPTADPARAAELHRRAAELWSKACAAGDERACTELGGLERRGAGVPADETAGLERQQRACLRGEPSGCAAWVIRGKDLVVDAPQALDGLADGCRRGDPRACFMVGVIGSERFAAAHIEVPMDALARACASGHAAACNAAGLASFPPDAPGFERLERACALGDAPGCHHLALALELPGSHQDSARAADLYSRACRYGYAAACARRGLLLASGEGVAADPEGAVWVFEKGCDLGSARACHEIGVLLLEGMRVAADAVRGLRYLEQACAGGELGSCARVGRAMLTGQGGERDEAAGVARLEETCTRGGARACLELTEWLKSRDRPDAGLLARTEERLKGAASGAVTSCRAALGVCYQGLPATSAPRWALIREEPALLLLEPPTCDAELERSCQTAHEATAARCDHDDEACWAAADLVRRLADVGLGSGTAEALRLEARGFDRAKKACAAGSAAACIRASTAHREGRGTKADARAADNVAARACKLDPNWCD
jgi:uncharacterized protein